MATVYHQSFLNYNVEDVLSDILTDREMSLGLIQGNGNTTG